MKNRIRTIRKEAGETQTEFASKLDLSRNYIYMIENGERSASDRTIHDICNIYGVNETWLRSGEGEPYAPKTRNQEIAEAVARAYTCDRDELMQAIIDALSGLTDAQIGLVYDVVMEFKKITEKNRPE